MPVGAFCSFSGATLVRTARGDIPISEVDVGDEVFANDETTGETGTYPVSAVWSHDDPITGTVTIDGEPIETTPNHPFRTVERGWLAAGDLQPGDAVVSLAGVPGVVGEIAWDRGPNSMWNLTVGTAHTYTVGRGAWLVHNENCASPVGVGDQIAQGHAWDKHVIKENQFPWISSRSQFADHVQNVIRDADITKQLARGRTAYWDNGSKTVVIVDPFHVDFGSAFQPKRGIGYFFGLE